MTIPFFYQKRERHTLVSMCRTGEETRFCVNILDGRLAQLIASGNTFVLKDGNVEPFATQPAGDSRLRETLKTVLQEYLDKNKPLWLTKTYNYATYPRSTGAN